MSRGKNSPNNAQKKSKKNQEIDSLGEKTVEPRPPVPDHAEEKDDVGVRAQLTHEHRLLAELIQLLGRELIRAQSLDRHKLSAPTTFEQNHLDR